jgi:hypothetical protein
MVRRVRAGLLLLLWGGLLALAAPAAPGLSEEPMAEITVDLQDGFVNDVVAISADGREVLRDERVKTRFQIGRARSVRIEVPEGRVTLAIEVPTRNLRATAAIDTSQPVFVGISITTEEKLEVRVQSQPFGYL